MLAQIKKWKLFLLRLYLRKKMPNLIYYIGSTEVLPPPLREQEEHDLISQLDKDNHVVKATLIEHNLRLVVYIAKKFENTGINIEDLVSIGTIGLIKAVNTFEPKKNIKLATYASRCIENEILMYLRRNQKNRVEISLDEPLNVDWDGNELLLSDVLGTDGDMIYKKVEGEVEKSLLRQAMYKLNNREKVIIQLRFGLLDGNEKTQKEVADILGISQSYISRLEKRILKRLQREIRKIE